MENPIKMDDLGVPLFSETSICFFKQKYRFESFFNVVFSCGFRMVVVRWYGSGHFLFLKLIWMFFFWIWARVRKLMMATNGPVRLLSHMFFFFLGLVDSFMMQHATTLVLVVATHIFFGKFHPDLFGKIHQFWRLFFFRWVGWNHHLVANWIHLSVKLLDW